MSTFVSQQPGYAPSSTNLFVRCLSREVDDDYLREIFSAYGSITSSMVMRDIHSGQSLGTAFVRYSNSQEALRALCEADGMPLFGKKISVQWAKQQHDVTPAGQDRLKMYKLFLRNVPIEVAEKNIVDLVAAYGTVKKVSLHNDTAPVVNIGTERCIVFITFVEEGAAERALRAVHNTCPFEQCCGVPLMCKLINDAIKSKKQRMRSCSSGSQPNKASPAEGVSPVSTTAIAIVPATPVATRTGAPMSGLRKLSLESFSTSRYSPLLSGADESNVTTPNRSYGASQWDVLPAAATPVGVFVNPTPKPIGAPSSSSAQRGSANEASRSSRFCHSPYSLSGVRILP